MEKLKIDDLNSSWRTYFMHQGHQIQAVFDLTQRSFLLGTIKSGISIIAEVLFIIAGILIFVSGIWLIVFAISNPEMKLLLSVADAASKSPDDPEPITSLVLFFGFLICLSSFFPFSLRWLFKRNRLKRGQLEHVHAKVIEMKKEYEKIRG